MEKPDLEFTVATREQREACARWGEGRDIRREVSLRDSVSLYSQWEQRWEGAHPPGDTHVAADPTAQGGAEGEAGRAESRAKADPLPFSGLALV